MQGFRTHEFTGLNASCRETHVLAIFNRPRSIPAYLQFRPELRIDIDLGHDSVEIRLSLLSIHMRRE